MTFIAVAVTLILSVAGTAVGTRIGMPALGPVIAITVMGAFILHVVGWNFDELKKVQKKLEEQKDTLKSDPPEA
mgnify:FL=1